MGFEDHDLTQNMQTWDSDNWAVKMPFRPNRPGGLRAKSMALQAAASSGSSIESTQRPTLSGRKTYAEWVK